MPSPKAGRRTLKPGPADDNGLTATCLRTLFAFAFFAVGLRVASPELAAYLWSIIRPFAIGGTSGCLATCIIQPIDFVKVRIQLGKTNENPVALALRVAKEEGIFTFWRGLSAALFRQVTYGTARLGIFGGLRDYVTPPGGAFPDAPILTRLLCSLTAGGLGSILGTPSEVALVRMQADTFAPPEKRRGYKHVVDALFRIASEEGFGGFFIGVRPTIARALLVNVGMFMTYDKFKGWNHEFLGIGLESQVNRFLSGALSGWCAATLSIPLDFIKIRLQRQSRGKASSCDPKTSGGETQYTGILDCVQKVSREEGLSALFQGYWTYVMRLSQHIMLTWVIMDNIRGLLDARGW